MSNHRFSSFKACYDCLSSLAFFISSKRVFYPECTKFPLFYIYKRTPQGYFSSSRSKPVLFIHSTSGSSGYISSSCCSCRLRGDHLSLRRRSGRRVSLTDFVPLISGPIHRGRDEYSLLFFHPWAGHSPLTKDGLWYRNREPGIKNYNPFSPRKTQAHERYLISYKIRYSPPITSGKER